MNSYMTHPLRSHGEKTIRVYVDRKLEDMPYALAGIRDYEFSTGPYSVLFSCDDVAWIDEESRLTIAGKYPCYTRAQILSFARQICRERGYSYELTMADIHKIAGSDRVIYLINGAVHDKYNGFM